MDIAILAAGAAGMYCGSCMRDNTLAAELTAAGHRVRLLPLFTPLRSDEEDLSVDRVFYGGINVFLQQASRLFRSTPRAVDWLWDRPGLLRLLGQFDASTRGENLGATTVSILAGKNGNQQKELDRLLAWLEGNFRAEVVSLPNAMFLGLAEPLRRRLGATVVCELTGEDIFLEGLPEEYRREACRLISQAAQHVDCFLATSRYYADCMAEYLHVPRQRIKVVYPGIAADDLLEIPPAYARPPGPPTVGYLARVCPEKGMDMVTKAVAQVRGMDGLQQTRLVAAGWVGRGQREWLEEVLAEAKLQDDGRWLDFRGEVDRAGKRDLLASIDVLCVPAPWPEAKGLYMLEGWAAGLPFVGFNQGSFPELIESCGAGVLVPPGNVDALADALADLLRDKVQRDALGRAGRQAVLERFSAIHMGQRFLDVVSEARR